MPWRISMVLSNISFFNAKRKAISYNIKNWFEEFDKKEMEPTNSSKHYKVLILIPRIVKKLTLYFANFQFLINHRNQCSIIVAGNIESIIDIFRKLFQQTLFVGSYSNLIEILRPFICKKMLTVFEFWST